MSNKRLQSLGQNSNHYVFGIYLNNKVIGLINDCGIEDKSIELGYFINPEYQNNGYCTEALKALISHLFSNGFTTIITGYFDENPASGRVMEKAGMTKIDKTDTIEYRGKKCKCLYYQKSK